MAGRRRDWGEEGEETGEANFTHSALGQKSAEQIIAEQEVKYENQYTMWPFHYPSRHAKIMTLFKMLHFAGSGKILC